MFGLQADWSLEVFERYFTIGDYAGGEARWCPGCGDHGILTSVQRVEHAGLGARPVVWTPNPPGSGPGIPCDAGGGHEQNVPAPGEDVTLEVTLIYPLTVPLVNRVIFGIFVNFSTVAHTGGRSIIAG